LRRGRCRTWTRHASARFRCMTPSLPRSDRDSYDSSLARDCGSPSRGRPAMAGLRQREGVGACASGWL
jgi:hypothetical protein